MNNLNHDYWPFTQANNRTKQSDNHSAHGHDHAAHINQVDTESLFQWFRRQSRFNAIVILTDFIEQNCFKESKNSYVMTVV